MIDSCRKVEHCVWLGIIAINFSCSNVNCTKSQIWSWSISCFPSSCFRVLLSFLLFPILSITPWTTLCNCYKGISHGLPSLCHREAPAPSGDSRALCCVPSSQHNLAAGLSLGKPAPHKQGGTCTGHCPHKTLQVMFLAGCILLFAGQSRTVITRKQRPQSWNKQWKNILCLFFNFFTDE